MPTSRRFFSSLIHILFSSSFTTQVKMKYSVAAVSALVAVALAKPEFLNSKFEVQEGKPFTLEYSGCSDGCTITLQTGASSNLKDVKVLTCEFLPNGCHRQTQAR